MENGGLSDAGDGRFQASRGVDVPKWSKSSCLDFLKEGYWFPDLSPRLQADIVQNSRILRIRSNSSLYRIGDPVDGMYASLEGDLRVHVPADSGDKIFLRALGPGAWFGDSHLLDGTPRRTFSVRARSAATVLFLPREQYLAIVEKDREAYQAFVRLMCIHTAHLVRLTVEARSEAPVRTARALIRLANAHGMKTGRGIELDMKLSQTDLASLVGVSRQYMNELLSRWHDEGIVQWNSNGRHLLSIERLSAMLTPLDDWLRDAPAWA